MLYRVPVYRELTIKLQNQSQQQVTGNVMKYFIFKTAAQELLCIDDEIPNA